MAEKFRQTLTPARRLRFLLIGIGLLLILAIFVTEVALRMRRTRNPSIDNWTALNTRWVQPFVGFGDFRFGQGSLGSPEEAGYIQRGPVYVYTRQEQIHSVAERGTFLYPRQRADAQPEPGKKRVFILGGSAALGDGANNGETRFGGYLEARLRARCGDSNIHVVTAAIRSFVTSQERVALEMFVLPLRPDAVIFLHGYNDANQLDSATRPGDPYNQGVVFARNESWLWRGLEFFGEFSKIADYIGFHWAAAEVNKVRIGMYKDPTRWKSYVASITAIYEENLQAMAKRCHQENVPCFFYLQPALSPTRESSPPFWPAYLEIGAVRKSAPPLPSSAKFYDWSHHFDQAQDLFMDSVHLNSHGQDLEAQDAVENIIAGAPALCPKASRKLR